MPVQPEKCNQAARQEKHFLKPIYAKEGNSPPRANSFPCERGCNFKPLLPSHLQQDLNVELGGISDAKLSHDNQYILLIARREKVCEGFTHHSSNLPHLHFYFIAGISQGSYNKSENK